MNFCTGMRISFTNCMMWFSCYMSHNIAGPTDEEMTPSPAEMQNEGDDAVPGLAVSTEQTRNVGNDSEGSSSASSKKSTLLSRAVTDCSKNRQQFQEHKQGEDNSGELSNDVPLKQRLRSARQHKSDAAIGCNSGR